jgi:putative transposase
MACMFILSSSPGTGVVSSPTSCSPAASTSCRDVCVRLGGELREFNGEDDRVRLLVHYPPKLGVSVLVNRLKAVSTHYLRKEFDQCIRRYLLGEHVWSPSYLAAPDGGPPPEIIKELHRTAETPGPILPAVNGQ